METKLLSFVALSRMASWLSFICLLWAFRSENAAVVLSALLIVIRRLPSLLASGIAGFLIEQKNVPSHHLLFASAVATAIAPLCIILIPRTESHLISIAVSFGILSLAEGFQKPAFFSFSKLRIPKARQESFFKMASFVGIFCTVASRLLGGYLSLGITIPQVLLLCVGLATASIAVLLPLIPQQQISSLVSFRLLENKLSSQRAFAAAMKYIPVSALCFALMSLIVTEFPRLDWENPDKALVWTYLTITLGMLGALKFKNFAAKYKFEFAMAAGLSFLLFSVSTGAWALFILTLASFFYAQIKVFVESSIPAKASSTEVARKSSYAIIFEEVLVCILIMAVGLMLDVWSLRAVSTVISFALLLYPLGVNLLESKHERSGEDEKVSFNGIKKISY